MKPTMEDRKETIKKQIEGLVTKYNQIADQRNTLNRQLSQIQQDVTAYQGQFKLISDMITDRDADKPEKKVESFDSTKK